MSTFNEVRHAGIQVLRVWVLCVSLKCVKSVCGCADDVRQMQ